MLILELWACFLVGVRAFGGDHVESSGNSPLKAFTANVILILNLIDIYINYNNFLGHKLITYLL